jgi:hypothetical protein
MPNLVHEEQQYLLQLKNDLVLLASKEIETLRRIDRIRSVHTNHRSDVKREMSRQILARQFSHLPFTFGLAAIRVAAAAALKGEREQALRKSPRKQGHESRQPQVTVPPFYDIVGEPKDNIPAHDLVVIGQIAKKFGRFTTETFINIVLQEQPEDVTNRFGFVNKGKNVVQNDRPELGPAGPFDRDKLGEVAAARKPGTGGVPREGDDWIPAQMPQRFSYFMGNQKCNTPVQPPSNFDNTLLKSSGELPYVLIGNKRKEVGLQLEHVYGYRGNHTGQNLFMNCQGELGKCRCLSVYPCAHPLHCIACCALRDAVKGLSSYGSLFFSCSILCGSYGSSPRPGAQQAALLHRAQRGHHMHGHGHNGRIRCHRAAEGRECGW